MKFRHEYKHIITVSEMITLRQRLNTVLIPDKNGIDNTPKYEIRSLYFDNHDDKALREKIDGVSKRKKFRIRYYNGDTSFIRLEKKSKVDSLCSKESTRITFEQAEKIINGNTDWMMNSDDNLIKELYFRMKTEGLRPKTIVDYTREAYTFPAGNVRVTLDSNIRTGLASTDFLSPDTVTVPTGKSEIILEVKWDEFLPDIVRDTVALKGVRSSAFSKYAACRIYG